MVDDLLVWCCVHKCDRVTAKKMYIDYLVKGYNALQEQKEKYADVLRKVVEKINKVKEIEI
jgi:hypothetical protein